MALPTYEQIAPARLPTSKIVEKFGEGKPFAIVQLSGIVEEVTYRGTHTEGKVMNGAVQAVDKDNNATGDIFPAVFTGAAVVNSLEDICQSGFSPFVARFTKVQKPGQQPMWMLK